MFMHTLLLLVLSVQLMYYQYHTVASYSQRTSTCSDANLYENCAVSFGYRESDFAKCKLYNSISYKTLAINAILLQ